MTSIMTTNMNKSYILIVLLLKVLSNLMDFMGMTATKDTMLLYSIETVLSMLLVFLTPFSIILPKTRRPFTLKIEEE